MANPEIAVLVSSFERPGHLRRVLTSLEVQQGVEGKFEVVVTDDGSRDETEQLVRDFAKRVSFPVHYTTHPHDGFQLCRCRNEGVAASTADYILFLDGDCLVAPDHLRIHLDRRQKGVAMGGYCVKFDQPTSESITEDSVRRGDFVGRAPWSERFALLKLDLSSRFYSWIGHSAKPKLFGGNIGIHRSDYELVNGYDENFHAWGCEDDDLRLRLRRAGCRVESILWWTCTYHLWHPKTPTSPDTWADGQNVDYLLREVRLTRCINGLTKRHIGDLEFQVTGGEDAWRIARQTLAGARLAPPRPGRQADIEVVVAPGNGQFQSTADCKVLLALEPLAASDPRLLGAHLVLCDSDLPPAPNQLRLPLNRVREGWDWLMNLRPASRRGAEPRKAA